jgi:WD40 repeat protein
MNDPKEWSEVMRYSPDGKKLGVGSHDNNVYIYDVEDKYNLIATLKAHNSFITCFDWSQDGTYIRSMCGAYEKLYFNVGDKTQDHSGLSNTRDFVWHTSTMKIGVLVEVSLYLVNALIGNLP